MYMLHIFDVSNGGIMSAIKRVTPRQIKIETNINPYAAGSVMVSFGNTKVHVTVMVEESIPPFLKGSGQGWITAEYAMLPASSNTRIQRERSKVSGRTQEIQRLIGRSLRAIVDLKNLGERSLLIDCDVIVADGGTRTASITGAYVALELAIKSLLNKKLIAKSPIKEQLAALSVGISKEGEVIADLNYIEDSSCETDMNIVMTSSGKFVEVQGTAEGEPFSREQLDALLECAQKALMPVFEAQRNAIARA
jgi:ribonuclease PH